MGFDFTKFSDERLDSGFVTWLIEERWPTSAARYGRLWDYYQNPMVDRGSAGVLSERTNESSRGYVQAQEVGLPTRITGLAYTGAADVRAGRPVRDVQRKEVVIENDIAWRINAMVDFLFGKPVKLISRSPQAARRRDIEAIVEAVFSANGGIGFFQDMAVLGSVYGFVDCMIRPGEVAAHGPGDGGHRAAHGPTEKTHHTSAFPSCLEAASRIGLELIEAPRALPVLDEGDYRRIVVYVQNVVQARNRVRGEGRFLSRLLGPLAGAGGRGDRDTAMVTEVLGPRWWQRYEDRRLVAEGPNVLGEVPVVHIQNLAQPYFYEGLGDVEQLIPLQDELNTRLSDRASRLTMQAFKMYLAKGIEGIEERPVAPGRMWYTDNPEATVESFGGDTAAPSEDRHIAEVRDALDKVSGVTPVVAGLLRNKLGNLTSGVALKMTFMGMLAKTLRKQRTYGQGIAEICRKVLALLDARGVYHTDQADRRVEVVFPDPLPADEMDRLNEARAKMELGVPAEQVLGELGYGMANGQ